MPSTGTPGNIYYPDSTAPVAPLENLFLQLATSVNVAFGSLGLLNAADLAALALLSSATAGQAAKVIEGGAIFMADGTKWVQMTTARFASTSARDTAYAKASSAYLVSGAQAVDNSSGITYLYTGSAWTAVIGDSGWQSFAAASGWTIVTQPQYRKLNNVVFVRGQVSKNSGAITAAETATAALPAGYRPSTLEPISAVHSNGTPMTAGVQPAGVIAAYPAVTSPSVQIIFHGSFIAEA